MLETARERLPRGGMRGTVPKSGGRVAEPALVPDASEGASFGAREERGFVPVEERDEIRRGESLTGGKVGEGMALRPPVPRADELAVVAAEDPVAEKGPEFERDRTAVLDREVGDAAAGVELVRGGDRPRRADRKTRPTAPAAVRAPDVVHRERSVGQDLPEKAGGSAPRIDEAGVFPDPAEAGPLGVGFLHEGRAVGEDTEAVVRAHELAETDGEPP